jgi:hypothetical protein
VDTVAGFVEVGWTGDTHEIVVSHPPLKSDASGLNQILISPRHARHLVNLLIEHAVYLRQSVGNPKAGNTGG